MDTTTILLVVIFACAGAWFVYSLFDTRDKEIRDRLDRLGSMTDSPDSGGSGQEAVFNEELEKPFAERVIMPGIRAISKIVQDKTSSDYMATLQKQLASAGYPGDLRPQEFLTIQIVVLGSSLALAAFFSSSLLKAKGSDMIVHLAAGAIFGFLMPRMFLSRRIQERQKAIQLGLADLLDLLTVSVEAGLGFDAGIAKCIEKLEGALSDEFRTILREIRVGKARKQALRDAADRMQVHDIDVFFSALIQAEQLGVSLAKILRVQSDQLRLKRRQRAEEKAQKAPIKMMFPMVLFIFPTIFIVLMGPAVLQAFQIFAANPNTLK